MKEKIDKRTQVSHLLPFLTPLKFWTLWWIFFIDWFDLILLLALVECKRNSQVFVVFVNVMQFQHMRMLDQFQNGNLPLNLGLDREKGGKRKNSKTCRLVSQLKATEQMLVWRAESGRDKALYKISTCYCQCERLHCTVPSSGPTRTASLCWLSWSLPSDP